MKKRFLFNATSTEMPISQGILNSICGYITHRSARTLTKNAHALNLQSKKPKEMPNKGPSDIAIRYDRKAIAADLSAEQLEEMFRELDNYFAQKQPPKQTLNTQNYENKQRAI